MATARRWAKNALQELIGLGGAFLVALGFRNLVADGETNHPLSFIGLLLGILVWERVSPSLAYFQRRAAKRRSERNGA